MLSHPPPAAPAPDYRNAEPPFEQRNNLGTASGLLSMRERGDELRQSRLSLRERMDREARAGNHTVFKPRRFANRPNDDRAAKVGNLPEDPPFGFQRQRAVLNPETEVPFPEDREDR